MPHCLHDNCYDWKIKLWTGLKPVDNYPRF